MLASKDCPVGMSSRLRQATSRLSSATLKHPATRARHSEATEACSSVELVETHSQIELRTSWSSCLPNSRTITKSPLRH
jgi:hypothetical protein